MSSSVWQLMIKGHFFSETNKNIYEIVYLVCLVIFWVEGGEACPNRPALN